MDERAACSVRGEALAVRRVVRTCCASITLYDTTLSILYRDYTAHVIFGLE